MDNVLCVLFLGFKMQGSNELEQVQTSSEIFQFWRTENWVLNFQSSVKPVRFGPNSIFNLVSFGFELWFRIELSHHYEKENYGHGILYHQDDIWIDVNFGISCSFLTSSKKECSYPRCGSRRHIYKLVLWRLREGRRRSADCMQTYWKMPPPNP